MFIPLTVGGGVRTVADVRRLLNAGADKVSFNSAAVANPQVIRDASAKYGAQCIVVAIDAKRRAGGARPGWDVYTHGGRTQHRARRGRLGAPRWPSCGAGEILLTSMDRDGTKIGFDLALTRAVADAVAVPVIASGGVGALAAPVRRHPHRRRRRGAGREHLPLRRVPVREAKAHARARRHPGAAVKRGPPRGGTPAPPREVRIIGGRWKRSKLPVADRPGLRPTPDRVRETLFNWLGQDLVRLALPRRLRRHRRARLRGGVARRRRGGAARARPALVASARATPGSA